MSDERKKHPNIHTKKAGKKEKEGMCFKFVIKKKTHQHFKHTHIK